MVKFKIGKVTIENQQRFSSEDLRRSLPELEENATLHL
jgi:hypothetical protein